MFGGYYLKFGDVTFPNFYIVQSTYRTPSVPRVENEYLDGNYNLHIEYAPKNEERIEFNVRPLFENEWSAMIAFFQDEELTIKYFDTKTGTYKTGIFTCKDMLSPTVLRNMGGKLVYNELSITLVKKREAT